MRTARIVRWRPRRSSAYADCAAGFIIARTAIIRYPRRRRARTAKRAEFELASSTYSVLNRTRRVDGSYGRSASRGRTKAKIGLQNLAYNIRRLVTLERMAAA